MKAFGTPPTTPILASEVVAKRDLVLGANERLFSLGMRCVGLVLGANERDSPGSALSALRFIAELKSCKRDLVLGANERRSRRRGRLGASSFGFRCE